MNKLFMTSVWVTIHFGTKPMNGDIGVTTSVPMCCLMKSSSSPFINHKVKLIRNIYVSEIQTQHFLNVSPELYQWPNLFVSVLVSLYLKCSGICWIHVREQLWHLYLASRLILLCMKVSQNIVLSYFTGKWMDIDLHAVKIIHIEVIWVISQYINSDMKTFPACIQRSICLPVMCIMFTTWKWPHPSLSLRTQRNLEAYRCMCTWELSVSSSQSLKIWKCIRAQGCPFSSDVRCIHRSRMAASCLYHSLQIKKNYDDHFHL
jgi:hypothetical protein